MKVLKEVPKIETGGGTVTVIKLTIRIKVIGRMVSGFHWMLLITCRPECRMKFRN